MIVVALVLALLFAPRGWAQGPYDLEFVEVADGVTVAYRPDVTRLPVHGNVTILFNEKDVVVVDSGASPASARQIVEHIRTRTSSPVTVLVNTHGHDDHVLGNQVFVEEFPNVQIMTRPGTRDYLASGKVQGRVSGFADNLVTRRASGEAEMSRLLVHGSTDEREVVDYLSRYYEQDLDVVTKEYANTRVVLPTTTFDSKVVLTRGSRRIALLNLGPGKSGSAAIVYLPEEKVVIAGDVVTHPIPYGFANDAPGWLDTLRRLAELEFTVLVPGHGDVLRDKVYLQQVIELVDFVVQSVGAAVEQGFDEDTTREQIDFSPWQERFTRGDAVLDYRFEGWFIDPIISRTHRLLSPSSGE